MVLINVKIIVLLKTSLLSLLSLASIKNLNIPSSICSVITGIKKIDIIFNKSYSPNSAGDNI